MAFDPLNPNDHTDGGMTRGEVLGHAAAEMLRQFMIQKMPVQEISRLMLLGYVGIMKAARLGDIHKARSELREVWENTNVTQKDEKHIIEIH